MKTQNVVAEIISQIRTKKASGVSAISCDDLIVYLDKLENSAEANWAQYQADLQLHIEDKKIYNEHQLEMFRAVILSGQNALRSSFLLNGGAAVALLAFVGHLAATKPQFVYGFSQALESFVLGVLAITVASGFTYISQLCYHFDGKTSLHIGRVFQILAVCTGLGSYGFFVWGGMRAHLAFGVF